jgi:hypothetical protein
MSEKSAILTGRSVGTLRPHLAVPPVTQGAAQMPTRQGAVFLDHVGAVTRLICHARMLSDGSCNKASMGRWLSWSRKPRVFRPYTKREQILTLLSMTRGVTNALSSPGVL